MIDMCLPSYDGSFTGLVLILTSFFTATSFSSSFFALLEKPLLLSAQYIFLERYIYV